HVRGDFALVAQARIDVPRAANMGNLVYRVVAMSVGVCLARCVALDRHRGQRGELTDRLFRPRMRARPDREFFVVRDLSLESGSAVPGQYRRNEHDTDRQDRRTLPRTHLTTAFLVSESVFREAMASGRGPVRAGGI